MMFWYGGHWAFWQTSLMWLGMILFWALLIWALYALIATATRRPRRGEDDSDGSGARQILDQRLARGEIDEAEYRRLRDVLGPADSHEPARSGSAR